MSSGSALLRQLQARRKLHDTTNQHSHTAVILTKKQEKDVASRHLPPSPSPPQPTSTSSAAKLTLASLEAAAAAQTTNNSEADATITIEVCLGPDCATAGGGAALLEIEDLVRVSSSAIKTISGGCRDHCTEGPNVRVLSRGSNSHLDAEHVKVNCPDACRRVMSPLLCTSTSSKLSLKGQEVEMTPVAKLLARREDTRRWRVHRENAAKERRLQAKARSKH